MTQTHLAPLIFDLTLILAVAGIATVICHYIRQPIVLGYLVAGLIVGPYTSPVFHITDVRNILVWAELGVIFLMFSLGLEFSFRKLAKVGFPAITTGLLEVIGMVGVGFAVGDLLGWGFYNSLFLGAAIAISSTTIIIKAFEELGVKRRQFAQIVFGILIVEDLLAILLLVLLSTIVAGQHFFSGEMLWATFRLLIVVGGWFIGGYFIVPHWMNRLGERISIETLTVVSIALCLCLAVLAASMNYSVALGAFIMGSILSEAKQSHQIERVIEPIRNIFGAVFFVSVGMLINPTILWQDWKLILLLSAIVIVAKLILSMFGAFLTGCTGKNSIQVGFSMAQIGEFSFITLSLGATLGVINPHLYPALVAVAAVTTFATPYLIKYSEPTYFLLQRHLPRHLIGMLKYYTAFVGKLMGYSAGRKKYQAAVVRMLVNAIVVAVIFTLMDNYATPLISKIFSSVKIIALINCLVSITFCAPFLWGMIFSFRFYQEKSFMLIVVPAAFALLELVVLSLVYFENSATIVFLVIMISVVFGLFNRSLENSYSWLEQHWLKNFGSISSDDQKNKKS